MPANSPIQAAVPPPPDPAKLRADALAKVGDPNKLAGFNDNGFGNEVAGLYKDLGNNWAQVDQQNAQYGVDKINADYDVNRAKTIALDQLANLMSSRGRTFSGQNLKQQADTTGVYENKLGRVDQLYQNALMNSVLRRQQLRDQYDSGVARLQGGLGRDATAFLSQLAQQDAQAQAARDQAAQQSALMQAMMGGGGGGGGGMMPAPNGFPPGMTAADFQGTPVNFTGAVPASAPVVPRPVPQPRPPAPVRGRAVAF